MGFLTGKTVLITGGGRSVLSNGKCGSIGYGIATAYAKEGANIVLTGRNMDKLNAAKEELERLYGVKVLALQADVAAGQNNEALINRTVRRAVEEFGGIQVLINNAQASASGVPLVDHTTEQFDLAPGRPVHPAAAEGCLSPLHLCVPPGCLPAHLPIALGGTLSAHDADAGSARAGAAQGAQHPRAGCCALSQRFGAGNIKQKEV